MGRNLRRRIVEDTTPDSGPRPVPAMAQTPAEDDDQSLLVRRGPWIAAVLTVSAVVVLTLRVLYLLVHYGPFLLFDDAFIAFRYAKNLALGQGLVFNAGEKVEGFTSFLWTVLLSGFERVGADVPTISVLLAFLSTLGTALVLYALGKRLFAGSERAALLMATAPLLYAATGAASRFVISGMETSLFTFLVTLSVYVYLREAPPFVAGLSFAVAALTRPEGVLYFAAVVLFHLLSRSLSRSRAADAGWLVAGFLSLYLPFFAWRFWYFGFLFPNTFYAKTGDLNPELLERGADHLVTMIRGSSLEVPLVLAALALLPARRIRTWFLPVGLVFLTGLYVVAVGGDFLFSFGPRFLVPVLPLVFLAAAQGTDNLARLVARYRLGSWVAALCCAVLLANALFFSWPRRAKDLEFEALLNQSWTEIGKWLDRYTHDDAVVAVGAVGRIPYYSGQRTVDMLGLTDAHIAHVDVPLGKGVPGHEKSDTAYVLERDPDYFVFVRLDPRGHPTSVDWRQFGEAIETRYQLIALARWTDFPGPWVLSASSWTPDLGRLGYQAAIYGRRETVP